MKRSLLAVSAGLLSLVLVVGAVACSKPPSAAGEGPAMPQSLPKSDLSTPEASVRTYLDWTNLAYRMANSAVASNAASPYENVRVDSYIELNRQKKQAIEQSLVNLTVRHVSVEGTHATVVTKEEWRYRYFSLDTVRYTSPERRASYDATYTVVKDAAGWLVDKVDAQPLTKVE